MTARKLVTRWNRFGKFLGHVGDKRGFTLIELLAVVGILGVLAAAAVPNVGKFIGSGQSQSWATELHNVQTATMAMMSEAQSGRVDVPATTATDDLGTITSVAQDGSTTLKLSDYMSGLNGTKTKSRATYTVSATGTVVQTTP